MSEDNFNHILEYSDMCDKHSNDAVNVYMEFEDSLDNFEEAYCGEWDSEEDFARHIVEECYDIERMMDSLANYSIMTPTFAICLTGIITWAQTAMCSAVSDL